MRSRLCSVTMLLAALTVGACASGELAPDAQPAALQREYRTGSKFPVKDPLPLLTQQERDRQIDDARAAAQSMQTGSGAPRGAISVGQ